jgi:3-hydroxyisobutyrate dehydrogenase
MNIGLLGTGLMGAAIVQRLLEVGHQVFVWNRTSSKLEGLARAGAVVADSPRSLAESADVIISILTNADAIKHVYEGPAGVLSANLRGKLVIEMSTVQPHVNQALLGKLAALGAEMIECPVGGTVAPAREGKLLGFVGGSESAVARARPVLEQMCRKFDHLGPVGAGTSFKLCVNLPLLVYWQALGESLALIRHLNLDPERLLGILSETSGAPAALKFRVPALLGRMQGGEPGPAAFNLASARKDLQTMLSEGQKLGVDLPTVQAAIRSYGESIEKGFEDCDSIEQSYFWMNRK